MKLTKTEQIQIIEKEIEWSLSHPAVNLSKDFQKGFVAGLQQAINLLKAEPIEQPTQ